MVRPYPLPRDKLVCGSYLLPQDNICNLKITWPQDLTLNERLEQKTAMSLQLFHTLTSFLRPVLENAIILSMKQIVFLNNSEFSMLWKYKAGLISSIKMSHNVKKTYLRTCAPSEDSDQTAHLRSLIRIFTWRTLASQGCKISSYGQWRLCHMASCSYTQYGVNYIE